MATLVDEASADAHERAVAAVAQREACLVLTLRADIDGKGLQRIIKAATAATPTPLPVMALVGGGLIDGGEAAAGIKCIAVVPKELASVEGAGIRANAWLSAALAPGGGQGGGNELKAQGQAPHGNMLDDCAAAARKFAR
jgi:hypothetical protein